MHWRMLMTLFVFFNCSTIQGRWTSEGLRRKAIEDASSRLIWHRCEQPHNCQSPWPDRTQHACHSQAPAWPPWLSRCANGSDAPSCSRRVQTGGRPVEYYCCFLDSGNGSRLDQSLGLWSRSHSWQGNKLVPNEEVHLQSYFRKRGRLFREVRLSSETHLIFIYIHIIQF